MRIDRMPLHARAFGDGGDARMRRPPLRVQIDSRLDDAAAGFRLIFRPLSKRIAALPNHCTLLYPHIDARP